MSSQYTKFFGDVIKNGVNATHNLYKIVYNTMYNIMY